MGEKYKSGKGQVTVKGTFEFTTYVDVSLRGSNREVRDAAEDAAMESAKRAITVNQDLFSGGANGTLLVVPETARSIAVEVANIPDSEDWG